MKLYGEVVWIFFSFLAEDPEVVWIFLFLAGMVKSDPDFFLLADMVRPLEVAFPQETLKLYGFFLVAVKFVQNFVFLAGGLENHRRTCWKTWKS